MIPPRRYEVLAELRNKHHFMLECCVREFCITRQIGRLIHTGKSKLRR